MVWSGADFDGGSEGDAMNDGNDGLSGGGSWSTGGRHLGYLNIKTDSLLNLDQ